MNSNPLPCSSAENSYCGAHCRQTRLPCNNPPMPNGRCKLHGGNSQGAPTGMAHGQYKHGRRTKVAMAQHKRWSAAMKELRLLIKQA